MVEYGIVTTNKFHFLSDDEGADPSEILGKAAQIKKVKGTSISKVPQTTAPAVTNLPKPEKPQTEIANKENTTATRGRGRGRGNGREGGRDNREKRHDEGHREVGAEGERKFDGERRGGRGRGRGNFNGERGERRFDGERGERRFDGERGERRHEGGGERGERRFGGDRKFDGERRHDGERRFDGERRRRPEGDVAPVEGEERPDGDRRPTRGGRGRGRGAIRGDRISGSDRTGVRAAPKKEGHGKGNWGTEQDELKGETEPTVEATDAEKPTQEDENADKNDSGVEVEKEEEKPVGMTLQEWKEKNKAVESESFNVRKPNEDKKLNLAPLKKSEDENKDSEEFVVLRREPREKHIDISVNFAPVDRGFGGNRGNRDGFRGRGRGDRSDRGGEHRGDRQERGGDRQDRGDRGPRGGYRGDRNRGGNQFNLVNDQFPALGGGR